MIRWQSTLDDVGLLKTEDSIVQATSRQIFTQKNLQTFFDKNILPHPQVRDFKGTIIHIDYCQDEGCHLFHVE